MSCKYPDNTPLTSYRKGCRCAECRAVKAEVDGERKRRRPCRRCGTVDKAIGGWYCDECGPKVIIDRIKSRVLIDENGCWVYQGSTNREGYAPITGHRGEYAGTAHRLLYEAIVGPVSPRLQLDHLCNVPSCCNPDHLEPVTPKENVRRSIERGRR